MENLTIIVLECQTPIGIAGTRIRDLQEACRDKHTHSNFVV